jgi:hypothetical protein
MIPQQAVFAGIWQASFPLGRIPSTAIAGLAASNYFHGRLHLKHVFITEDNIRRIAE